MALITGALIIAGCGADESGEISEATVEGGHEGHNHAPGEHGKTPELATVESPELDWCVEHAVPESECTKCNPSLIAGFKESGDWCAGHDLPESHCRLCNPGIKFPQEEIFRTRSLDLEGIDIEVSLNFRPNAAVCATDGAIIQFASANTAERAGITIQTVQTAQYESTINAPAEIVFDETEATVVTSTILALVSRWLVSPGDAVNQGEVMAILKSPDIAELRSSLVSAHAHYKVEQKELDRNREMMERNLISEADVDRQGAATEEARAAYVSARGLLLSAGLVEEDIDDVLEHGNLSNQFALRAPASGMVVERVAQLGELVDAGRAFATIADPTSMWIEASLTEEELKDVVVGNQLTFSSDGRGIDRVGGEIIWVSRFLDPHTRTGIVRAKVLDPDHQLRAGEFGRARIIDREDRNISLVPKDAVQWEGCCNVVFVKETVDRYRPRKVELFHGDGPYYQVTDGVQPGEQIVVEGAFLLKTELKKSSIGAGCCGLDPVG
jgi:cobalt-zinc-cadmium efflux system membrane fusion protein